MPMENSKFRRGFLYPKDIQIITGRSYSAARRLSQKIREHFCKETYELISIYEFCSYTGMEEEMVYRLLKE